MAKRFPLRPKHPERICWGCDHYCSTQSLACGNGSERTQHPIELFGDDWYELDGMDVLAEPDNPESSRAQKHAHLPAAGRTR